MGLGMDLGIYRAKYVSFYKTASGNNFINRGYTVYIRPLKQWKKSSWKFN